jgi:LDH2 family malate/lactate/ureidoglycolate dehydrogenase
MIDRSGKPLIDPKRAYEGMLLPRGGMEAGDKGFSLAMIIGLLAGTLGGATMGKEVIDFNHDDGSVTNAGQAIAAINIRRCRRVQGKCRCAGSRFSQQPSNARCGPNLFPESVATKRG